MLIVPVHSGADEETQTPITKRPTDFHTTSNFNTLGYEASSAVVVNYEWFTIDIGH